MTGSPRPCCPPLSLPFSKLCSSDRKPDLPGGIRPHWGLPFGSHEDRGSLHITPNFWASLGKAEPPRAPGTEREDADSLPLSLLARSWPRLASACLKGNKKSITAKI